MSNAPAVIDDKTVEEFLFSSNTKLNPQQKQMFIKMAVRSCLDPFKREIYAIPFGNNFNIVTGYQTYIARANATGLLNGWKAENAGDKAVCTIYRKDWDQPFTWEALRKEFDKGQGNWKTMPDFMLKKVCIAQAFRLAFPEHLGGLPYTQDEMEELAPSNSAAAAPGPGGRTMKNVTPMKPAAAAPVAPVDTAPPVVDAEVVPEAVPDPVTPADAPPADDMFPGPGIADVRAACNAAVAVIGMDKTLAAMQSVAGCAGVKGVKDIGPAHYAAVIETVGAAVDSAREVA